MKAAVKKILKEASALPDTDRAELIDALICTLAPEDAVPLDDAWLAELDRRCAEIDAGRAQLIPWEVIRDRARRRYPADG